ncbi:MAG: hypothetical protein E6G56_07460 [Actinobacteria bacterium]|nr:MAG: hypothetical protein E6G56_07460 [Actinomycetota bacterium]
MASPSHARGRAVSPLTKREKRNLILGVVVAIWGAAVLVAQIVASHPRSGGAYGAGQTAGVAFAVVMLAIGVFTVAKILRTRRN